MKSLAVVLLVLLVALALRAVLYSAGLGFGYADERDYLRIAESLAAGTGFNGGPAADWPDEFRAPLLPYLLAGLFRLGFSVPAARWVLALTSSVYPVALLLIVGLLSKRRSLALLAAAWGVLHPYHARASFELTTDALAAAVAACAGLVFVQDQRSSTSAWDRMVCGGLLGVAACLRSNLLLMAVPVFALWAWQAWESRSSEDFKRLLTAFLAWLAVLAPFVAVRSVQEHRFLFLTDAGSEILWRGNSERSEDYLDGTRTPAEYVQDYRDTVGDALGKPEAESRALGSVRHFVQSRTGDWVRLKARMFFETWRPWPSLREDADVSRLGPPARRAVQFAKLGWYLLIFILLVRGVARGGRLWRRDPRMLVPLGWIAIATLFGTAFSPDPRYRLPFDMALVMLNVPWGDTGKMVTARAVRGHGDE